MKKISIILGNASINNGNRGCTALCYSILYLLDQILSDENCEYSLYLTDSLFPQDGIHTIEVAGKSISFRQIQHVMSNNLKNYLFKEFRHLGNNPNTPVFRNADFVLDLGQGDSFADIYGKPRFEQINLIHKEANKFHKPYCILPQTIGPFESESIRKEANIAIAGAGMVMARDKKSYDYVKQFVPEQDNIKEYIDVAFFLPYTKQQFDKQFIHVGLNISALLWHGGYTRDNQFGLKDDYPKVIREIINYFSEKSNVMLHLIAHVVTVDRHVENDYAICYDIMREYNRPHIILAPLFLSPVDAKDYISGMDFFMGARMHSTIAAFSSGVPVVPMAYSRKFNGLFVDTLQYEHMIDLKKDRIDQIISMLSHEFDNRLQIKQIINNRLEGVVADKKEQLEVDLKRFLRMS